MSLYPFPSFLEFAMSRHVISPCPCPFFLRIWKLKQHLFSHFQTKDLGKLKYFLGIEIAQSNSGAVISHNKYVLDILKESGMLDFKLIDTLMNPNVKLVPGQGEPLRDPGRYRRLVGRLNYLTIV